MTSLAATQGNRVYIDKALYPHRLEHCVHYSEGNHLFIDSGTCCSTLMSSPFFTDLINRPTKATRFKKKDTTLVPNSVRRDLAQY